MVASHKEITAKQMLIPNLNQESIQEQEESQWARKRLTDSLVESTVKD